jgi:hypothetical protein
MVCGEGNCFVQKRNILSVKMERPVSSSLAGGYLDIGKDWK